MSSSADGRILYASSENNISASYNFGVDWTSIEPWDSQNVIHQTYSIGTSASGSKVALSSSCEGCVPLWVSFDGGSNRFVSRDDREYNGNDGKNWSEVAWSGDGKTLAIGGFTGSLVSLGVSHNSGFTWKIVDVIENPTPTSGIAVSADGKKIVAVVDGGRIYTSAATSGLTTEGADGHLTGGQYSAIELHYIGNGRFMAISHEGSIFSRSLKSQEDGISLG